MLKSSTITFLLIISTTFINFTEESQAAGTEVPTLGQVTVTGQAEDLLTGKSELSQEVLQQLPEKNSSLSDTITVLPRVQIGEKQRTSENAGEILPSKISISGGRAYENYYSVDGVGLNSLLDPLADNPSALDQVPGHPQRTFIHQSLIDSVTVYDSNIPAKFGRFVGGVVDAKTRMPSPEFGGNVSFRSTRDSWTQFHVGRDERSDFFDSNSFSQQPRFKKYVSGVELDIPINERMGLLGSYKRIQSDLRLKLLDDWSKQEKTLETFFLKYAWAPETPYTLELTTSYTPSEEDFFIVDTNDSNFTIERGGYSVNGTLRGDLPVGMFEITAAYLENANDRDAPKDFFSWRNTPSKNWGEEIGISRSREGGFGKLNNTEKSAQIHADLQTEALTTGFLSHAINLGAAYTWDYGEYDREETTFVYNTAKKSSVVVCAPDDPACVGGEQYFGRRNRYAAQSQDADINYIAAYLEDLITIGPVELRPGVRFSHDDFMDNTNTAHRLAGSWDILGNGKTVLTGGYNRYYGETLLTYKLREAIVPFVREERKLDPVTKELSDWTFDRLSTTSLDKFSELDTPYSDEWTVGLVQQIFGGSLEINYLERKNRDQFAREKITEDIEGEEKDFFVLNNNGSSDYDSVKVVWEREWQNHYLNLNYTYSDQESSNESYDDTFDEEDIEEQVWYDGRILFKKNLPREDYYRNHAFSAIYVGKLPGGFTFTNVANYLGGYESIERVTLSDDERIEQGIPEDLDVFEKIEQPDYWTFDWRLGWETQIRREQLLTVTLEVNNIFDRAPPVAGETDVFELGRQVWVGMTYQF